MEQVAAAVAELGLPPERLERLKTAVGEATMNAMEHGNRYDPDLPVAIRVQRTADELIVSITDHGGGQPIPEADAPDLEAKLAGLQSPRGWGLFLIRSMVDDMRVTDDSVHHTVDLIMNLGAIRRSRCQSNRLKPTSAASLTQSSLTCAGRSMLRPRRGSMQPMPRPRPKTRRPSC